MAFVRSIARLFSLLLLLLQQQDSFQNADVTPPRRPPGHLLSAYSMDGLIPIEYMYVDDTNEGKATHFVYSASDMEKLRKSMQKTVQQFENMLRRFCSPQPLSGESDEADFTKTDNEIEIKKTISIRNKDSFEFNITTAKNFIYSLPKAQWAPFVLYINAWDLVIDKELAIYGSVDPWLEIYLLLLGAKHVVTIEYNHLTYEDDRITTIAFNQFSELYSPTGQYSHRFDSVISLSAFDHDGLGRYGDPINPNGDFEAMESVQKIIKPDGKFILTVPIGPDVVVFNLHRRYGKIRLPELLKNWYIIEKFGWIESRLEEEANWRQTYEPVLILGPSSTTIDPQQEL